MPTRTFQVSSDLFWGFRLQLEVESDSSHASLLRELHAALERFFLEANLLNLAARSKETRLHLHDSPEALLAPGSENAVFYACDHEH